MSRGLGAKQQEMLDWLQQQWAASSQPNREQLMDAFVVDTGTLWRWDQAKRTEIRKQGVEACKALSQAKQHPDRPKQTPRSVAEAYRRALRTLVDRELVKVVADDKRFYRYCDPEADNPLQVTVNPGRYNETLVVGEECGRRREPEISASEERRQALLSVLPADGSWMKTDDMARACWTELELGDMPPGFLTKNGSIDNWERRWLRPQLLQLQKAGKVEAGTIPWNGTEIEPKQFKEQKVVAARLSVVPR